MLTIQDYIDNYWQRSGGATAISNYLHANTTCNGVWNLFGVSGSRSGYTKNVDGKPFFPISYLGKITPRPELNKYPCIKAVLVHPDSPAIEFTFEEIEYNLRLISVPIVGKVVLHTERLQVSPRYYRNHSVVSMAHGYFWIDIYDSDIKPPDPNHAMPGV